MPNLCTVFHLNGRVIRLSRVVRSHWPAVQPPCAGSQGRLRGWRTTGPLALRATPAQSGPQPRYVRPLEQKRLPQ
jgi:hypothetical protein